MDLPYHPPGSLHHQSRPALDASGKVKEGSSEDHVTADGEEENKADGEDLEHHSSYGERSAEVKEQPCCPTRYPSLWA